MIPLATSAGEHIIRENSTGDFFYVVFSGTYSAYKEGRSAPIKVYATGDSFGELALLFAKPRQASVVCDTSGCLYAIDRRTFKRVVSEASMKGKSPLTEEQKMLKAMTNNIHLAKLTLLQQRKVCELMKKITFKPGEEVIREGRKGNYFYAVASGKLDVTKGGSPILLTYGPNDCFGDMALVAQDGNAKRAATVKARTECVLYALSRSDFRVATGKIF